MSIDGTDFAVTEAYPFDSQWFSHKLKRAGIRHEIGLSLESSDIVWLNGGFKCGEWPDLKIARSGVLKWISPNERVIADDGCAGEKAIVHPQSGRSDNAVLRKILARHESANSRMRKFKVLQGRWMLDRTFHPTVVCAIVNLIQLEIENGAWLPEVQL